MRADCKSARTGAYTPHLIAPQPPLIRPKGKSPLPSSPEGEWNRWRSFSVISVISA